MAANYTRRIILYINGEEIKNDMRSIQNAYNKANGQIKDMTIGSKEYITQTKKIAELKKIMNEHNQVLKNGTGFWGNLQGKLSGIPGILGQTASGFASITKAALAFIATPFGAILAVIAAVGMGAKELIKNSIEFGKAASSLSAITGATGKDLDFLKQKAREISKESTQSATDMLKAFEVIGSKMPALLKNGPLLAEVTKNAVMLSESSGGKLSVEDAATAAAAALNQFNIPLTDSARVVNVLAAGSLAGSAEVDSLRDSLKNVGPVASGAGLSIEQTTAALEVLAEKGLLGEEAGTKLRGTILKLQDASMGYASGSFNLRDALVETNAAIAQKSTEMEKDALISKIFGMENITAGKIMLANIDKYDSLTTAVTGTNAAMEMAKVQQDNLAASNQKFGNAWKNLMLSVEDGDGVFTNIWKGVVDFATTAINWIAGLKTGFINLYNSALPVRTYVEGLGMSFKNMFAIIMLPLKEVWNSFTGLGKVLGALVTGNFKEIPKIIGETYKNAGVIAVDTVKKIGKNIGDAWNNTLRGKMEIPIAGTSPAEIAAAKKDALLVAAELLGIEVDKNDSIAELEKKVNAAKAEANKKENEKAAKAKQDIDEATANAAIAASEREYERKRMLIEENVMDETEKNKQLENLEIAKSAYTVKLLEERLKNEKLTAVEEIKLKEEIEKEKFNLEKILSKRRIAFKKTSLDTELTDLESSLETQNAITEQKAIDENLSDKQKKGLLLANEIDFLTQKIALYKEYGLVTTEIEAALVKKTSEASENAFKITKDAVKGDKEREKELADLKKKYSDEETLREQEKTDALTELDKVTKNGSLVTHEEYERMKTAITEKYGKKRFESEQKFLEGASAILDIASNLTNAAKDRELKKAGDNAAAKEAIEKKYAKKSQKIAIAQAIVNGALAVTKILAETPKVDFGIMTAILIAGAIATTAAEVASISNQKFKIGGFTDTGVSDSTPVGVVHASEWVASAPLLRNPETRRHIDYLENVQRGLTPRFDTTAISGAVRGFQAGGFGSSAVNTTSQQPVTIIQQSDPALLAAIQRMNASADNMNESAYHLARKPLAINTREIFKSEEGYQSAVKSSEY